VGYVGGAAEADLGRDMSSVHDADSGAEPRADYAAFGLRIRSELALPELAPAGACAAALPAVVIRLGAAGTVPGRANLTGPTYQVAADDFLLEVQGVARYRVRNGEEIVVEPAAEATPALVRLFLLGTPFGALCHQRGLLPLHASAIEVDGGCVAFAGFSGAGKSTLAAFFAERGYPVICDDVCSVTADAHGPPLAWPGVARLKLWRDALDTLHRDPASLEPTRIGMAKYHVMIEPRPDQRPLPLRRLYVLREARIAAHEGIHRLAGSRAFEAVIAHTFRRRLSAPLGKSQSYFANVAALVQHVPVHVAGRRWGFQVFAAETDALERHFRAAGA
jgi:hypothetical protein